MLKNKIQYFRGKINMDDFEAVISPADRRKVMAIGVSQSGHLTMNGRFLSVIKNLNVDLRCSKDKRMILINDEDSGDYAFPKSGRIKDVEFVRSLSAAGLAVPCRYIMKYSE